MPAPTTNILDVEFLVSARDLGALPPPAFSEIAFAGRSNVGKSSLINTLLGRRKVARTSNTPGCTRGINVFRVTLGEAVLDFVDLPGYGYAKRGKSERRAWGPLIESYLRSRANLRAVVVIVDARRGVGETDQQLLDFVVDLGRAPILVLTKLDKLALSRRKPLLDAARRAVKRPLIGFSAIAGDGREELLRAILTESYLK
jgi:GTP-binding protein